MRLWRAVASARDVKGFLHVKSYHQLRLWPGIFLGEQMREMRYRWNTFHHLSSGSLRPRIGYVASRVRVRQVVPTPIRTPYLQAAHFMAPHVHC